MKKLSKLKLKEFAVMNDREMKSIVGGYSNGSYETDSKYCKSPEKLYSCVFALGYETHIDYSNLHDGGVVCALNATEAREKLLESFGGNMGSVAVKCS